MKRNKQKLIILVAVLSLLLTACSSKTIENQQNTPTAEQTPATETPSIQMTPVAGDEDEPELKENNGIYYLDVSPVDLYDGFVEQMSLYPVKDFVGIDVFVDEPNDLDDLVAGFEAVWFRAYNEDIMSQQRPYIIEYDAGENVWIVSGSNVCVGVICVGKVSVMISGETGEVLSAWGAK